VPAGSAAAALSAGHVSSLLPDPAATLAAITAATGGSVDLAAMAAAQQSCPSTQSLEGSSLHLHAVPFATGHILCDVSRGLIRPIVPERYCGDFFQYPHHRPSRYQSY
jgi:hypothetical protein